MSQPPSPLRSVDPAELLRDNQVLDITNAVVVEPSSKKYPLVIDGTTDGHPLRSEVDGADCELLPADARRLTDHSSNGDIAVATYVTNPSSDGSGREVFAGGQRVLAKNGTKFLTAATLPDGTTRVLRSDTFVLNPDGSQEMVSTVAGADRVLARDVDTGVVREAGTSAADTTFVYVGDTDRSTRGVWLSAEPGTEVDLPSDLSITDASRRTPFGAVGRDSVDRPVIGPSDPGLN